MRIGERLEELNGVLERLREKNNRDNIPIIVEGKNDEKALRELHMGGPIIPIKQMHSVFHIIERLRGRYEEVIVMTDWDRTGGRLAYKIKKACEANDIRYIMEYRKEIIKYVKKDVKDVEGLPKFIRRAEIETGKQHP